MKKILLVEDDRNLSRSMDIMLTLEGFEVITVYNGDEALNKLFRKPFDLLITDIVMPYLDGLELIRKLRSINRHIPIMVVSGNLNEELNESLQELNIRHVLPKPIKPFEFRQMISSILAAEKTTI